jgi:hypothetical protein
MNTWPNPLKKEDGSSEGNSTLPLLSAPTRYLWILPQPGGWLPSDGIPMSNYCELQSQLDQGQSLSCHLLAEYERHWAEPSFIQQPFL